MRGGPAEWFLVSSPAYGNFLTLTPYSHYCNVTAMLVVGTVD